MFTRSSSALADIADTINDTVDQIELGEALDRLSDLAGEGLDAVADQAALVAAPTAAIGREAARHPRKVAAGVGLLVAVVALLWWWSNRTSDAPEPDDHPGVV